MLLQECLIFTNFVLAISRLSDECLMKQELGFTFFTQYQAVMRKFTLAEKTMFYTYTSVNSIFIDLIRVKFGSD